MKMIFLTLQTDVKTQVYCLNLVVSNQLPRSCLDMRCHDYTDSGVYTIYPKGTPHYSFDVYCDQETDGGGWTVSFLVLVH